MSVYDYDSDIEGKLNDDEFWKDYQPGKSSNKENNLMEIDDLPTNNGAQMNEPSTSTGITKKKSEPSTSKRVTKEMSESSTSTRVTRKRSRKQSHKCLNETALGKKVQNHKPKRQKRSNNHNLRNTNSQDSNLSPQLEATQKSSMEQAHMDKTVTDVDLATDADEPEIELDPFVEIKFVWRILQNKTFKVRKYAPLENIVKYLCEKESLEARKLYFVVDDREVDLVSNNSVTLGLKKSTIIEGSVLSDKLVNNRVPILSFHSTTAIRVKVQFEKKNDFVYLEPDDKLEMLFAHVVIKFKLHVDTFNIFFDGSRLKPHKSLKSIDVEKDDCFDVHLK